MIQKKPLVLVIFDGWGHREDKKYNAIANANTPNFDQLYTSCPHTLLNASGHYVGLPTEQMGNSEVGHMNIGSGRIVYQDLTRIARDIDNGDFHRNPIINQCLDDLIKNNKALHIMGLVSPGGVHSHQDHLFALIKLAASKGLKKCYIHAFLDGRDTPPKSAKMSLEKLIAVIDDAQCGEIKTLAGRYYAMDRDKRWQRIQPAYDAITKGHSEFSAEDALLGLDAAYQRGETDEFVKTTCIGTPQTMVDGDAVLFFNFRSDRARQLCHAFLDDDFSNFQRNQKIKFSHFLSFTEYEAGLATEVIFAKEKLEHVFGAVISQAQLKQLRIAETEKYAHVTFFFNGGEETPFTGEERILISSPKVATYDLQPEMSAYELTDKLVEAINSQHYDVIICNYANADMVGHTGNYEATIQAIEALDICLGRVMSSLEKIDGELLITADHGNADNMYDEQKQAAITSHTTNLVPFIYKGRPATFCNEIGALSDIAPTMLYALGLDKPQEMTGKNLLRLNDE